MSREAVRIACKSMYDHEYYTSKEEAILKDPNLKDDTTIEILEAPQPKRARVKESVPHKLAEWKVYKNILPSSKTINNHKQTMAIQQERDAAISLLNKFSATNVTRHYDATSRSQIYGDWPALILIFFAYEDRAQIIRLVIETYEQMAATLNTEEFNVTAKMLWEKTNAVMTES